jgi:hypothetical protein
MMNQRPAGDQYVERKLLVAFGIVAAAIFGSWAATVGDLAAWKVVASALFAIAVTTFGAVTSTSEGALRASQASGASNLHRAARWAIIPFWSVTVIFAASAAFGGEFKLLAIVGVFLVAWIIAVAINLRRQQ